MNPIMKLTNGGLEKDICELSKEHLGELLRLWNMGHAALSKESQGILAKTAFGDGDGHKLSDDRVQELFDWEYLQWENEGRSFIINPELDSRFEEMSTRYTELLKNL